MPELGTDKLYEIKDFQTYGGQQVLNVYHYLITEVGTPTATQMATIFNQEVMPEILAIQPQQLTHQRLEVVQVNALDDFTDFDLADEPGLLTGSPLPTFVAASIRLARQTRETRSGWKRYVAGDEAQLSGSQWETAFDALIQNVATALDQVLTLPTSLSTARLVIVRKRAPFTLEDLPPAEWIWNDCQAQAQELATTQNTRKVGRGA